MLNYAPSRKIAKGHQSKFILVILTHSSKSYRGTQSQNKKEIAVNSIYGQFIYYNSQRFDVYLAYSSGLC